MRAQYHCPTCNRATLHEQDPDPVNHLVHLLATIFLCGFWLPIWIIMALGNSIGRPMRCLTCGTAPASTSGAANNAIKAIGIVGGLFLLTVCVASYSVNRFNRDVRPGEMREHVGPVADRVPNAFPDAAEPVAKAEPEPEPPKPVEIPIDPAKEEAAAAMLRKGRFTNGETRRNWLAKLIGEYPGTAAAKESQAELDK